MLLAVGVVGCEANCCSNGLIMLEHVHVVGPTFCSAPQAPEPLHRPHQLLETRCLRINITDIDDKIILRARQNKLFSDFCKEWAVHPGKPSVLAEITSVRLDMPPCTFCNYVVDPRRKCITL